MEQTSTRRATTWQGFQGWLDQRGGSDNRAMKFIRYILRLIAISMDQFTRNDLSLRSGALTYAILLSMVPMLAMSTAVVKGLGGGNQLREAAYSYIENLERIDSSQPPESSQELQDDSNEKREGQEAASLTSHLRSAVTQLFDYVDKTNFATLGTFGVVGIFFSVLLVLGNIEAAMNSIWRVSKGRAILRKIADYLTLLILLPLSINLAFAASAFLNNARLSVAADRYIPFDWMQALILQAIPMLFITVSFYVMYIFFPNTKVKTVPALIGAAIAACCWTIIQNLYISMQIGVAKYNAIYGSFATVPLFLVWIYLSWLFILAGAQVAFAIQNEKRITLVEMPSKPSFRLSAAFDIVEKVYAAFNTKETITREDLTQKLSMYPAVMIETVLNELVEGGFLTMTETTGAVLPLFAHSQLKKSEIIEAILGNETADTPGGAISLGALKGAKQQKDESVTQAT